MTIIKIIWLIILCLLGGFAATMILGDIADAISLVSGC